MRLIPWLGVLAVVAMLTAAGQILFKFAAMTEVPLLRKFMDVRFCVGVALFLICPVLTIWALKHVDYSFYYATTALNTVFIVLGSRFCLRERIDIRKIVAIGLILIGIALFAAGS